VHDGEYDVETLRARAAIEAFEPDAMIVDNVPRGAMQELDATLRHLRANGRTKCVLGLRDVLDEPATVRREWAKVSNEEAIRDWANMQPRSREVGVGS